MFNFNAPIDYNVQSFIDYFNQVLLKKIYFFAYCYHSICCFKFNTLIYTDFLNLQAVFPVLAVNLAKIRENAFIKTV